MKKKSNILIIIFSIIFVFIDQLVKFLIRNNYPFNLYITDKGISIIKNFFYIAFVKNYGAAWGILSNNVYLLCIVTFIIFILLFNVLINDSNINKMSILYYSLIFGGLTGNLVDRVLFGYVFDYLNFYIFSYDYPVFNLADMFIVIGVIIYIISELRRDLHGNRTRKHKN